MDIVLAFASLNNHKCQLAASRVLKNEGAATVRPVRHNAAQQARQDSTDCNSGYRIPCMGYHTPLYDSH